MILRRLAPALAALACIAAPRVARAQEPWSYDASSTAPIAPSVAPPPSSRDPLILPGAILTSVGVASSLGGGILIGTGSCASCQSWDLTEGQRDRFVAGTTMLGGGIGVLAIGLPTLLVGLSRERPADVDAGAGGRAVGIALVSTGAASLGAGIGAAIGEATRGDGKGASIPLVIGSIGLGTILIPIGAPIWALSGRRAERPAPAAPSRRSSAESMKYAGITLTMIGGAGAIAGIITTVALARERGDFAGLGAAVIGGSVIGASTIFLGVGIPLWVVGAQRLGSQPASVSMVPALRIGPQYAEAAWRF